MSKPRPSRARLKAYEDARRQSRQAAITAHMKVLGEIAAGAAEDARSDLFEGFFEALAEDARGLLEETLAEIDAAHRRSCGHPPPAMKS